MCSLLWLLRVGIRTETDILSDFCVEPFGHLLVSSICFATPFACLFDRWRSAHVRPTITRLLLTHCIQTRMIYVYEYISRILSIAEFNVCYWHTKSFICDERFFTTTFIQTNIAVIIGNLFIWPFKSTFCFGHFFSVSL